MQSRDAGGSRFEQAKKAALRMVADLHGGSRMMVVLATSRVHRLTGLTSDQNELRRAIDAAEPGDTTTNLHEALLLACSVAGQHQGSHVYILSDGAFSELDPVDDRGAELPYMKIGERADNVGIVALDARRTFREEGGYQMFLAVRNYSPKPKRCNLEFYRNEGLIDVRPVELAAADPTRGFTEKPEVFEMPETTGIIRARLDLKDDLEVDNEAYVQLSKRRQVNVLLVTEGNFYLQRALNVDPNVSLSVLPPAGYTGQGGFDVVIFENFGPKQVGPGNHLYLNCGGSTAPVEIKGKVKNASIVTWERAHPVMRFVKFSQFNMQEALTASKLPWGITLAEHEQSPVVVVGEKGLSKSAYVGFPLLQTDFPLRVAFPIFFNNLVQWLAARPGATEGLQLRAGQTAPIELPEAAKGVKELTVKDPEGRQFKLRPEGLLTYFTETEQRGIYTVSGKGVKQEFAVNLLSRDESATLPRAKLEFGRRPVLAGTGSVRTAREVWRWLLLLAVVVLGIEWWVYHRRI
jgi:Ca-activated chloride channel homolog